MPMKELFRKPSYKAWSNISHNRQELTGEEDNRVYNLSSKYIRFSLDSLPYCFGIDTDLFLRKTNMKDIHYTNNYINPLIDQRKYTGRNENFPSTNYQDKNWKDCRKI
ncbi:hypothetical protein H8356DRAFT_1416507 [Neocallimastix lanati (nom. inval.)]|nr:hypothetical protein H8356DRAFT_1416507 [Neocallimastix sp. JGI-2020a]